MIFGGDISVYFSVGLKVVKLFGIFFQREGEKWDISLSKLAKVNKLPFIRHTFFEIN